MAELKKEDGEFLLLETGEAILLEEVAGIDTVVPESSTSIGIRYKVVGY